MENKKTSKKSIKAAEMPAASVAVSKAPRVASKPVKTAPAKPSAPKTTAHRHSKVTTQPTVSINYDEVARLAYNYWEERHHADGFAEEDWHRAEKAVRAR